MKDTVRLKDKGYPTSRNSEDGVPDDNNNKNSYKTEVQGDTSSYNDKGSSSRHNPEIRLITHSVSGSLCYLVFNLET